MCTMHETTHTYTYLIDTAHNHTTLLVYYMLYCVVYTSLGLLLGSLVGMYVGVYVDGVGVGATEQLVSLAIVMIRESYKHHIRLHNMTS